jgi:hypothetical protein
MPSVMLHIKSKAGGMIPEPRILLAYDSGGNWGAYRRMLDHRRVDHQNLCSRHASEEEYQECAHAYRIGFISYDDWDKLIADEQKFDVPTAWIDELNRLKEQHPQFINKIP